MFASKYVSLSDRQITCLVEWHTWYCALTASRPAILRSNLGVSQYRLLGMDEWIWQCQELYPDQLRVVKRLRQTEEIYSPQVAVKD